MNSPDEKYADLVAAVRAAGYHTTRVERMRVWDEVGWDRITCVSNRSPDGRPFGNSFWLTRIGERWCAGTWGSHLYHVPDASRVTELAIMFLASAGGRIDDFSDELKTRFALAPITDEELDRISGAQG